MAYGIRLRGTKWWLKFCKTPGRQGWTWCDPEYEKPQPFASSLRAMAYIEELGVADAVIEPLPCHPA